MKSRGLTWKMSGSTCQAFRDSYWPTTMFTVATVLNEWPAVPHPSVPSTVVTPLKHGSEESREQLVPGAPLGCNPPSQTSWEVAQRNRPGQAPRSPGLRSNLSSCSRR